MSGNFSVAPSRELSRMLQPNDPAVIACLEAARGLSLVQRWVPGAMKLSAITDYGWWGAKSYGASMDLGGPWSCEFIHRVCEMGLLGMDPQAANRAMITKRGRALLRDVQAKAKVSPARDGATQQNQAQSSRDESHD
jgi:hypothetical protein